MVLNWQVTQSPTKKTVQAFTTDRGARIYLLPLEAFPGFWVNSYFVLVDGYQVLIDTGSGFCESNHHLQARLQEVDQHITEAVGLDTLNFILITHGHIDHFGGLPFIRRNCDALIGIHELDYRMLVNPEERLRLTSRNLSDFLAESGAPEEQRPGLIQMFELTKLDFRPVRIDFTFESVGMKIGPFELLHVPGHSAGHVIIRLDNFLFSGDHVLAEISPHQYPERFVHHTGLGHYLDSLKKTWHWAGDVSVTLSGHNGPILDLVARIEQIRQIHRDRLNRITDILNKPHTIYEVSMKLFPDVTGYNHLLALEEAGAHVEYLYQHGVLSVENLDNLSRGNGEVPIRYCNNPSQPRYENVAW
jgi:glyoxylase-like metal-dependent hydrolase (beta-lactamase superfamily II)